MKYDVTIGIPMYRSEAYIGRALESALAQSYPSIEFLIVDDGSDDDSLQIVQQIKENHPRGQDIHILTHQKNQGVSSSRNQIIDEAQGDYLYYMDSDDKIAENTIDLLMHQILEHNAEMAFGSYEKIEVSGERQVYQYPSLLLMGEDKLANFAYRKYAGIQASACNYLVKTSLLRVNHLRFINTDYWEDLVFTFNLVTYISRAVLLPDITYNYLCRAESLSHYQERTQIMRDEIMKNVWAIDSLKKETRILYNKVYYPNRCLNIVMTDFYIACNILKCRNNIMPPISDFEIRDIMSHPATFSQICSFRQTRLKNLIFYVLSKLPPKLCVITIGMLGKMKKLI